MVREKPIYMLDMAIPRNIDNQIGMLNNYHLYNIDVLKEMSAQNAASRLALRDHAEEIIENYVSDYKRWLDHSEEDNVIESLNQSVDDILDYHLKYLFQRIKANEREQKIITRTMQAALKKAVRNPIIALKILTTRKNAPTIPRFWKNCSSWTRGNQNDTSIVHRRNRLARFGHRRRRDRIS